MSNPLYVRRQLLLSLPWVSHIGIYVGGHAIYYNVKSYDGHMDDERMRQAEEVLERVHAAGIRSKVVTSVPSGANVRYDVPPQLERVIERCSPTEAGIIQALNTIFPDADFIEMSSEPSRPSAVTLVQGTQGEDIDSKRISEILWLINPGIPWKVSETSIRKDSTLDRPKATLDLTHSRRLQDSSLRTLGERDEDFFSKNVDSAMRGTLSYGGNLTSIFVDTFPGQHQTIRPLLAAFEQVIITPRIGDKTSLDLTDQEILACIEAGRIKIACKRDIAFYEDSLLQNAAALRLDAVLGPRELGLYMASSQIKRNPILESLATDFDDTRIFLDVARKALIDSEIDNGELIALYFDSAIQSFTDIQMGITRGGPAFALTGGDGAFASKIYKYANPTVKTPDIELWGVGESMQAGMALNSFVLRSMGDFYKPHYEFIARVTCGKPQDLTTIDNVAEVLHGLQIPTYDAIPIDKYFSMFNGESIRKIRDVLLYILNEASSEAELKKLIEQLNLESLIVRGSRTGRAKLDIVGFGLAFVPFGVPIGGWLAQKGIQAAGPMIDKKFNSFAEKRQWMESKMLGTTVQSVQLADIHTEMERSAGKHLGGLFKRIGASLTGLLKSSKG